MFDSLFAKTGQRRVVEGAGLENLVLSSALAGMRRLCWTRPAKLSACSPPHMLQNHSVAMALRVLGLALLVMFRKDLDISLVVFESPAVKKGVFFSSP